MARKSRKNVETGTINNVALYIRTALYIRLSVEDNKKRGQSIDNQRLVLEDYIAGKPEFVVYNSYIDNGMTGTNFHRPGFQQMLADIEAGHINCVIVKDLSRLGRNSIDTGYYIERYFREHKVRFIAITDQFDTADPSNLHGGIMLPLKNMINEAYALDIGRKIKAQARQAMTDGEYIGARAPYGYRKAPDNCHKLLIDEEAAAIVRQIFEWAYAKAGINDIARRLNERGVLSPGHYKLTTGEITHARLAGSGKWQTWTVSKILDDEVYTGDLVQGKTKVVDHQQVQADDDNLIVVRNTHEAIISREMFETVRAYRRQVCEESKAKEISAYTPNIFKGKVFCAHCGGSLHRQRSHRQKGADVYFFHCLTNSRTARGACEGVTINEKDMISTLAAILKQELAVVLGSYALMFQAEADQREKRSALQRSIAARKQEIERNRSFIRGLYENYVTGILDSEEYFTLKAEYDAKTAAASGEVLALENGLAIMDKQFAQYKALERDAKTLENDFALTAALVDRLIERIEISHDKEFHMVFRFQNEFERYGEVIKKCVNM